jgi:hypothetical protein
VLDLHLEFCKLTDPRYQESRNRHYVANKAVHGRQLHFLVWANNCLEGIISASSAVYATPLRDKFFGITRENREKVLGGIVSNVVFRLDNAKHDKNLGTRTLALWRRIVPLIWEDLYGSTVFGFETLILQKGTVNSESKSVDPDWLPIPKKDSNGSMYRADNWYYLGLTEGNTKNHDDVGLTEAFKRQNVEPKYVYCKWRKGFSSSVESTALPSWLAGAKWESDDDTVAKRLRRIRPDMTKEMWEKERPEWQARAKELTQKREGYYGQKFYERDSFGKRLFGLAQQVNEESYTSSVK